MIEFEQKLLKDVALSLPVSFKNPSGETLKPYAGEELLYFTDICQLRISNHKRRILHPIYEASICQRSPSLLDFIYMEEYGVYDLGTYDTDYKILNKVQTGYASDDTAKILFLDQFVGGTTPEQLDQSALTGKNNIEQARATILTYFVDTDRRNSLTEEWYVFFEHQI